MSQGTPKATPQVQPPVSATKAADTPAPQLAAAASGLPPTVAPEVALAAPAAEPTAAGDPGHLIGSADRGGMSAAIEAAHEEAASALARLTYIEVLLYFPASGHSTRLPLAPLFEMLPVLEAPLWRAMFIIAACLLDALLY